MTGNRLGEFGCDAIPLVKRATDGTSDILQHRLVAADPSPWKYWAIVELDWDYPPYLKPLPGADRENRLVRLTAESTPNGTVLRVTYDYEQQTGRPEEGTEIRLLGVVNGDATCPLRDLAPGETVLVPPGFNGTVRASVLPRSATREGRVAYSNSVTIGARTAECPVLP